MIFNPFDSIKFVYENYLFLLPLEILFWLMICIGFILLILFIQNAIIITLEGFKK